MINSLSISSFSLLLLLKIAEAQGTTTGPLPAQCQTSISPSPTTTITYASEASGLANPCPTYGGSIAIAAEAAQDLTFTNLQFLAGDLSIMNLHNPINIYFPDLQNVNNTLWMASSQASNYVSYDSLVAIRNLFIQSWDFTTSLNRKNHMYDKLAQGSIKIQNSTYIHNTTLNSIVLPLWTPSTSSITISNNTDLMSLKLIGPALDIANINGNGRQNTSSSTNLDFSNLGSLADLSITRNYGVQINGLPSTIEELQISGNAEVEQINISSVATLKGSLDISSNPDLKSLAFPSLASVQKDFRIHDNREMHSEGSFPSLKVISGALSIDGPITNVSYADQLALVGGSFSISSTSSLPCSDIYRLLTSKKVLQSGVFNCTSPTDSSYESSNSSTSASTSTAISNAAIAGIVVGVGVSIILTIVAVIFIIRRRRAMHSQKQLQAGEKADTDDTYISQNAYYGSDSYNNAELEQPAAELQSGRNHPVRELPTRSSHTTGGGAGLSNLYTRSGPGTPRPQELMGDNLWKHR